MEWLDVVGSVVSAGSGGILGIAGSIASGIFKGRERKADREFKQKEWDQEFRMQELNIKTGQAETENELSITRAQGSYTGLSESLKADAAIGPTHMIVNDIKALYRPFLTSALWILAGWVFYLVVNALDGVLNAEERLALIRYMVYSVFFCASTATTWWFGDRALAPPKLK